MLATGLALRQETAEPPGGKLGLRTVFAVRPALDHIPALTAAQVKDVSARIVWLRFFGHSFRLQINCMRAGLIGSLILIRGSGKEQICRPPMMVLPARIMSGRMPIVGNERNMQA